MACIIGHLFWELYSSGNYNQKEGFRPLGQAKIRNTLNNGFSIGRAADKVEAVALLGPCFAPGDTFHYNKLVLTDPSVDKISREHGRIQLIYPGSPIQAIVNGSSIISRGEIGVCEFRDRITLVYEHLSQSGAPTIVLRGGRNPTELKKAGQRAEFKLAGLTDPSYFIIGHRTPETGLEKTVHAPVIKVQYQLPHQP